MKLNESVLKALGFEQVYEKNPDIWKLWQERAYDTYNGFKYNQKNSILMIGGNLLDDYYSYNVKITMEEDLVAIVQLLTQPKFYPDEEE